MRLVHIPTFSLGLFFLTVKSEAQPNRLKDQPQQQQRRRRKIAYDVFERRQSLLAVFSISRARVFHITLFFCDVINPSRSFY